METREPVCRVVNIRVVDGGSKSKHLRGKEYLLDLECGHQIRRTYSQGLPKSMKMRCPQCGAVPADPPNEGENNSQCVAVPNDPPDEGEKNSGEKNSEWPNPFRIKFILSYLTICAGVVFVARGLDLVVRQHALTSGSISNLLIGAVIILLFRRIRSPWR